MLVLRAWTYIIHKFFLIFFQQKNSKKYYPQNFLTFQNFFFYRGVGEHVDCLHHLQLITCGSVKNICQFSNFFLECICFHHLQLITCGTNELNVNNKLNFWNVFFFEKNRYSKKIKCIHTTFAGQELDVTLVCHCVKKNIKTSERNYKKKFVLQVALA